MGCTNLKEFAPRGTIRFDIIVWIWFAADQFLAMLHDSDLHLVVVVVFSALWPKEWLCWVPLTAALLLSCSMAATREESAF